MDQKSFIEEQCRELMSAKEDYEFAVRRLKERVDSLASGNNLSLFAVEDLVKDAKDKYTVYVERDRILFLFCRTLGEDYLQVYKKYCRNKTDKEEERA